LIGKTVKNHHKKRSPGLFAAQIMSLAQREQRAPEILEELLRIGVQPQETFVVGC